mmetsp:Transcript_55611/g.161110  ORF Transcript_55611/g.161110 Transcript_55611/m.161110 type:complete len:263 (+) Transcript_55611:153-941(+)
MASAPKDPGKRLCVRAAPLHRPFPREETCGDLDRQQDHLTTLAADGSRGRLVGDPHRDRHGVPWIMPELEGRLALAMREDHRRLPAEAKERPACRFELRRQLESQGVGPRVALGLGAELGEKPGPAELEGELPQSRRAETVVVVQAVGHRLAIQQHRQVPARGILGELRDCPSDVRIQSLGQRRRHHPEPCAHEGKADAVRQREHLLVHLAARSGGQRRCGGGRSSDRLLGIHGDRHVRGAQAACGPCGQQGDKRGGHDAGH